MVREIQKPNHANPGAVARVVGGLKTRRGLKSRLSGGCATVVENRTRNRESADSEANACCSPEL